jgi:iron(III) transport system substrate-binding protein
LLDEYRSPNVAQLYDWAQRITEISKGRVSGVYGGIIALGYNTELMARKKLPIPKCWKDLTNPVYKGEVMLGNPNSSGTAYLMLATLVQVFGEDEAFAYLRAVHPNVNQYARSGIGPMTAITRGETALGSTVLHGVINEIVRGFPVEPVLPCEGVGYEVGSVAIIKGTRNADAARKFVDWALSAQGQQVGLDVKEYAIPTNRNVTLPPQVPPLASIKVIPYDFAKYGSSAERKRLLERWEKEINAGAR